VEELEAAHSWEASDRVPGRPEMTPFRRRLRYHQSRCESNGCGPDELWVTDITEHLTREGKLYCAVVLDAFSRRVVGSATTRSTRAG